MKQFTRPDMSLKTLAAELEKTTNMKNISIEAKPGYPQYLRAVIGNIVIGLTFERGTVTVSNSVIKSERFQVWASGVFFWEGYKKQTSTPNENETQAQFFARIIKDEFISQIDSIIAA